MADKMDSLVLAGDSQAKLSVARSKYDAIYDSIFWKDVKYADTVESAIAAGFALDRFCYRKDKYDISEYLNKAIRKFGNIGYFPAVSHGHNSMAPHEEIYNPILRQKDSLKINEVFGEPNLSLIKKAQVDNKLVLVDFWASWCKPCIEELPHLNKAYEKFHSRRFEIVSISRRRFNGLAIIFEQI